MHAPTDDNGLSRCHAILENARYRVKPGKFLLEGRVNLGYGEFLDKAGRVASLVRHHGLGVEDRAVIISDDDHAVIEIFFGLIAAGVTAVILNPHGSPNEITTLVRASDASMIFIDESRFADIDFSAMLSGVSKAIRISPAATRKTRLFARFVAKRNSGTVSDTAYPALLAAFEPRLAANIAIPDSTTAYILFTSGTTSQPKGVEISHKSLFAQLKTFVRQYGLNENARIMNLLPLHHTDGLTHGAALSLICSGTLVRPMRFRVNKLPALLDDIYRSRVSHFITVPSMLTLIRQLGVEYADAFDTEDFQFIISTAAYLDPGLWASLMDSHNVRIVNVYGLTETVCEACYCGPDANSFRIGTVGKPVDCAVKVVDDAGTTLPPGEKGELCIKGDNVMKGYFRMPEETDKVLRDGWFHTGDVAILDEKGFVSIVGRKKSVIISGGYNIYPEDVNNVLMQMDRVSDAVTLGMPDETWGERVVSCVIASDKSTLSPAEISTYFLRHAAREKLPRDIYIMDEFPRGPAGKVQLDKLRKQIAHMGNNEAANSDSASGDLANIVTGIASSVFKLPVSDLGLDASPDTVAAWNSLAHVEFLMALEIEFGQRFSAREILSISNLGQAVEILQSKVA